MLFFASIRSDILLRCKTGEEKNEKGKNMAANKSSGQVRKLITRVLATGSLLAVYALGGIATTGVVMTAGVSPAYAQRGGGRGGGGGRGRGNIGAAVGIGVGAAILGGVIAADAANREASEEAAIENCMRRFKSYNPETREYIGRDGQYHPCP